MLDIEVQGFKAYHEDDIRIGAGATIERTVILDVAGVEESLVVEGTGSRIEARGSGFETRFGPEDLKAIPVRRFSMFDFIRAAPGVSATSPGQRLDQQRVRVRIGRQREHVPHRRHELHVPVQRRGAIRAGRRFHPGSAGAVRRSVGRVRQHAGRRDQRRHEAGSDRFLYDASYYGQAAGLTSQPVLLAVSGMPADRQSGYERGRYRDFTTNLGGPAIRDRLWFFAGYQYLRDYDSQPGTDPAFPRTYEQDKVFAKLTWRLAPGLQLLQSFHNELWVNPELPTLVKPFEATQRRHASVPAMTFGHLTHTVSSNTVWDVRVGRFVFSRKDDPSTGSVTTPSRLERVTGVLSGAPQTFGGLTLIRTTGKATLNHYQPGLLGADHQWRIGGQVERGEHHLSTIIPTGVRFVDDNSRPFQTISSDPSIAGGVFITAAGFVSDAITVGNSLTINAGLRFDHSRAISQDLPVLDSQGHETDDIVRGLGTLYTWNVWSPRLGVTMKLTADGRTMLRASYGRFNQGVLTGELAPFHPAATSTTTITIDPATGSSTRASSSIRRGTCNSIPRRAPRGRMNTRSAWIGNWADDSRSQLPTCARTAAISSGGRTSAASIAKRRGRCRMAACCRCGCSRTPAPIAVFC